MARNIKIALTLCFACILYWGAVFYPKWTEQRAEATIGWDVAGYYMYLPATFIYKDLKHLGFAETLYKKYESAPEVALSRMENTPGRILKYPIGQSIQYLPWFFAAHAYALTSADYPADGYSLPYQFAMSLGSWLVAFLGLLFLAKILQRYFSSTATALSLICIVFGSNYLDYVSINGAMTHNWLFTLYALLIWVSIQYYEKPSLGKAALLGALVGWATVTRPTEALSLLLPLFWGVSSRTALVERFVFFKKNALHLIPAVLAAGFFLFLQLGYWKYTSGHWIVYSYDDQGFSWLKPHYEVISSYRTGWLTYSPIFYFALLGFVPYWQNRTKLPWIVPVFLFLFSYIISAWDLWEYGGSLGMRAMIQAYPVWAFPLAACITWVLTWEKNGLKIVLAALALLFLVYNQWLTRNSHKDGVLWAGQMTNAYFWAVLGHSKANLPPDTAKLLDNRDHYDGEPKQATLLYPITQSDSAYSVELNGENQYAPDINLDLNGIPKKWCRFTIHAAIYDKEWDRWKQACLGTKYWNAAGEVIKDRSIRIHRVMEHGENRAIYIDTKIPKDAVKITCFVWNGNGQKRLGVAKASVVVFDEE